MLVLLLVVYFVFMVMRLVAAEPLSIPSLSAKHSGVAYGVALGFTAALHMDGPDAMGPAALTRTR